MFGSHSVDYAIIFRKPRCGTSRGKVEGIGMIKEIRIKNFKVLRDYTRLFNPDFNVIVGSNGAGKSTLFEAVGLALSGRYRGQWSQEALSPYWFNKHAVDAYFDEILAGQNPEPPAISIEVLLDEQIKDSDLARLEGKNSSKRVLERGLAFEVSCSTDFVQEYQAFIDKWLERYDEGHKGQDRLLPVEYFDLNWHSFASFDQLRRRPRGVDFSLIDTKSNMYGRHVDRYTRDLLTENISKEDGARLSVNLRSVFSETAGEALADVNKMVQEQTHEAPEKFGVQIDPSSFTQWQNGVAPSIDELPFSHAGQGAQSIAKVEVALLDRRSKTKTILIEEPENNLSHTKLQALLARIQRLGEGQQVIVTTHSSFVLNRLGLDSLILMGKGNHGDFSQLSADDVAFFQKLANFDTLRLVLADQVILVEGISDLLVVDEAIRRKFGRRAEALGIDIISMEGTKHKRWLELAKLLDKPVIAIRDNDGKPDGYWENFYKDSIGNSHLSVGSFAKGKTLEPQIACANKENITELLNALGLGPDTDFEAWATQNKSEAAFQLIALEPDLWNIPDYILDAVRILNGSCK